MKLPLFFILISFVTFGQVQIGQTINGESIGDLSGTNVSLSSDGSIIAIGAFNNDGNGINSGHVRIYENQGNNWTQIGQDIDGESTGDLLGISVSLSCNGRIVAIGASNNNSGHVRIYENQGNNWIQIGQGISGGSSQRFFGRSVSLSCDGSTVAIGASNNSGNSTGSAQVGIYRNQGNSWIRIGNNINDSLAANILGITVSLSNNGDVVAIGTPFDNGNGILSGHVRIFKNENENWQQVGQNIDGEIQGDQFGRGISLSGNGKVIAISSMIDNELGQVSIYEDDNGYWQQIGQNIDGEMRGDQFGRGLSLSDNGHIVAIGARLNNNNGISSGHVRVFQYQNNFWRQIGQDIDGEMEGDQSGISVSLSSNGTILGIGSNLSNRGEGEVRIFDLTDILLSLKESVTSRFKLFPNPAPSNVIIELPQEQTLEIQDISIYNNLGQRVFFTQETNINTSQFPKGIYVIQIRTNEGIASKKLIVE